MKTRIFSLTLAVVLLIVFGVGSALAAPKFKLVYYDGHMHTTRQGGSGTVADIKAMALSRGLSAVIITDHCTGLNQVNWASLVAECKAASNATFLALPAFEVTGDDGMFNRTHVNALNVADPFVGNDSDCLCPEEVWPSPPNPAGTGAVFPENVTKWVEYIHSQGGIAVQNHPSGSTKLMYGVNNMEVYNQGHVDDVFGYAKQLGYSDTDALTFGLMLNNLTVYGEIPQLYALYPDPFRPSPPYPTPTYITLREILWKATRAFSGVGQWLGAPQAPLTSWDELLLAYVDGVVDEPIFGLANSDAHNTGDLDCTDGSCSKVGVAKNGAYVKALTAKELYKAIKSGKTFATSGPSLNLDVNGELMGDTAYVFDGAADIHLSVNAVTPGFLLKQIDIIKNGILWDSIILNSSTYEATLEDVVTEDGYYRVEVTSKGPGIPQFAWSNPVFVRVPLP